MQSKVNWIASLLEQTFWYKEFQRSKSSIWSNIHNQKIEMGERLGFIWFSRKHASLIHACYCTIRI